MPDDQTIQPALSADDWALGSHYIQCYDSWSDEQSEKTGVGEISAGPDYLTLTGHQHGEIADFSAPTDRHALAALCLYEQPFGFTQEDVAALEREGNELCAFASDEDDPPAMVARGFALLNLAKRIAALLPPSP